MFTSINEKPINLKRAVVMAHDFLTTPGALALAIALRYPTNAPIQWTALSYLLPIFSLIAGIVFHHFRLYESKWRFASLPDLFNIFRSASVLAFLLIVTDSVLVSRGIISGFSLGLKAGFLYWTFQMVFLGGPRIAYRYYCFMRSRHTGRREQAAPILVLGRGNEAELVLRAIEGALRKRFAPFGILSPHANDSGITIRGVRVLGDFSELEAVLFDARARGTPIVGLVLAPGDIEADESFEKIVPVARRLGVTVSRLQTVDFDKLTRLKPIEIEDLLFRSAVAPSTPEFADFIHGKKIVVTGGGGSIGSDICARVLALGVRELMIIENSEPALFAIGELCAEHATKIRCCVADIRDKARIDFLFDEFKPDVVFHAAALKQLPQLEIDWSEGVKTNIFGSINVVDATARVGATGVLISTDKAVDPVSILGATKRFSEMYAQLVDADLDAQGPRIISVRFGNVLGSVGSVVPKFKKQIESGGPVTLTHPDMVRYFMTIREAVNLVIMAGAHSVSQRDRASVYVLKMGKAIRIYDLAEKMIRLAGYEPDIDIKIKVTGRRAGERLNEILFSGSEPIVDIGVDGVNAARTTPASKIKMTLWLKRLRQAVAEHDRAEAEETFGEAIPHYHGEFVARTVPRIPIRLVKSDHRG